MTYFLSISLLFINVISSFIPRNSLLPGFFLLVMMWILFGGNYSNADYENYNKLYDVLQNGGPAFNTSQAGLVFFMKITSYFGFSYNQFLTIFSLAGLILISSTVIKYTKKPSLVYLLYFIHPFLLDVVQIKHFFAMSVIIFSLRYLVVTPKIAIFKYVAGIVIASSFHFIALIYLPLIFLKSIKLKYLWIFVALSSVLFVALDYFNLIYRIVALYVPRERVNAFFENRANWGFFVQYSLQISILIMVYYSRLFLIKRNKNNLFIDMVFKANVYLLVLLPLYMINGTFERAFRIIYIPNYIVFASVYAVQKINNKLYFIILLLSLVTLLFSYHVLMNNSETVFYPIFESNYFFYYLQGY